MIRNLVLAGALALAMAAPAGATTVITQTAPSGGGGVYSGFFDLSSYLSDAEGRTFSITAATLTARAHSAPNYAAPTTAIVNTTQGFEIVSFDPITVQINVLRERTITYVDDVADTMTLSTQAFSGQSVSGTVSETLDTLDVVDQGATDGPIESLFPGAPPPPFPGTQHTTLQDRIVHRAIYGDLELSLGLDAAGLQQANFGLATYFVSPYLGIPDFGQFLKPSQYTLNSVSLAFDRVQTGGPPIQAPVPEPGTWALTILGFGLAGAALRRRATAAA